MNNLIQLALRLSLVAVLVSAALKNYAQTTLTSQEAFLLFLKHDTVAIDDYTEEYIYRFQKDKYYLIKEDEFEKRLAGKELLNRIEQFSKNTVYSIEYKAEFSDYDFELQGFNFNAIGEGTRINLLDPVFATRLPTNISVLLFFYNGSELDLFPIEEDKANLLLKERKNYKNGKVDRSINMKLYFTIDQLIKTTPTERRSAGELACSLLKVEFLANNDISNKPVSVVRLIQNSDLEEKELILEAQKDALSKEKGVEAGKQVGNEVITEVEKLLSNSELTDDLKAALIKSTIQFYEDKEHVSEQALYKPKAEGAENTR